jgi:uncharacterized protein (DUF433 family)
MSDPIDRWLPRLGPCLVCGTPGADQRHRRIEAIADLVRAGEDEEDVAREMEVPVEAVRECVRWAAEHLDGLERDEDCRGGDCDVWGADFGVVGGKA